MPLSGWAVGAVPSPVARNTVPVMHFQIPLLLLKMQPLLFFIVGQQLMWHQIHLPFLHQFFYSIYDDPLKLAFQEYKLEFLLCIIRTSSLSAGTDELRQFREKIEITDCVSGPVASKPQHFSAHHSIKYTTAFQTFIGACCGTTARGVEFVGK